MTKKAGLLIILVCALCFFIAIIAVIFVSPSDKNFYQSYIKNISSAEIDYINYPEDGLTKITEDDVDYVVGDVAPSDVRQLKQILKNESFGEQSEQMPIIGGSVFILKCCDGSSEIFSLLDCCDDYIWMIDKNGNIYKNPKSEDVELEEYITAKQDQSGFVYCEPEDTSEELVLASNTFGIGGYSDSIFDSATSAIVQSYNKSVAQNEDLNHEEEVTEEEKDPLQQFTDYSAELLDVADRMDELELNNQQDTSEYKQLKERYNELWYIIFGEEAE